MRILLVSWFFPPTNTMGALRIGKLSKFLLSRGHELRVVSVRGAPYVQTLDIDFPEDRVDRTPWVDVNWPPAAAAGLVRRLRSRRSGAESEPADTGPGLGGPGQGEPAGVGSSGLLRWLDRIYGDVVALPDAWVGWLPFAVRAGRRALKSEKFDLILASGPPFTVLVIGRILARWSGVPLVVEFRDRWSDDPYYPPVPWRRRVDARLEEWVVRESKGIVTVSDPWADTYRKNHGKPTIAVYNGFDPEEYPEPGLGSPHAKTLRIVYTGVIYPGRRDPSPLFEAVRLLEGRVEVEILFYGTAEQHVWPLARRHGVEDLVQVLPSIPYRQSLAAQLEADVLLFMQWNDPREQGNVPGKLFEYLASRRPILGLGLEDGVPATVIRERGAGLFSNDPTTIAGQLEDWSRLKAEQGGLPPLPERARQGLTREEQFSRLERFLEEFV